MQERVSANWLVEYLKAYTLAYRKEYKRLVAADVIPDIVRTPFVRSQRIEALLANDGVLVVESSPGPDARWEIAGGPAFMIDTEPTATPTEVSRLLESAGLVGQNIGIYRIVKRDHTCEHWQGLLPKPSTTIMDSAAGVTICAKEMDLPVYELLARLTLGFSTIVDLHLELHMSEIWKPTVIRHAGFVTGDRKYKQFYEYLAIHNHVDTSAWDMRSIWARVSIDVRRDIRSDIALLQQDGRGASITIPSSEFLDLPGQIPIINSETIYSHKLRLFADKIQKLESLLNDECYQDESVYQSFLEANPELLDFYMVRHVPKPRWHYRDGESPLGKKYVEPDLVLVYDNDIYNLVELERPDHQFATKKGQPTASAHAPYFQIAEWRDYINTHYDEIRNQFPGITSSCRATVIISRTSTNAFGGDRDPHAYLRLLRQQHRDIECWTYDDLIARAKTVLSRLVSL